MFLRRIRQPVRLLVGLAVMLLMMVGAASSVSAQPTGVLGPNDQVAICHATGSVNNNPYVTNTPNVDGIVGSETGGNAHQDHLLDVIPPFTYNLGDGDVFFSGRNWNDETAAIWQNDCRPLPELISTAPAVTVVDATCDVAPSITPIAAPGVTYSVAGTAAPGATVTVTATIDSTAYVWGTLPAGWVQVNASTATYTYTFANPDCRTTVSPLLPIVLQATCEDDAALLLPAEPEGVTYSVSGTEAAGETVTFTATIDPTLYVWGPIPAPLVQIDNATASWTFTFDPAPDCRTEVVPGVTVVDATCELEPSLIPTEVAGVSYSVVGDIAPGGTVTVTATIDPTLNFFADNIAPFVLVDASTATYTFTFADPDCGGGEQPGGQVAICHFTGDDTYTRLVLEDVAVFSEGHDVHNDQADIIPPFDYRDEADVLQSFPGQNWDAEGQAIYENNCVVAQVVPSPSPSPSPSPTPAPGVTPSPTPVTPGMTPTPKAGVTPTAVPAKSVSALPNTGSGQSGHGDLWIAIAGAAAVGAIALGVRKQTRA